MRDTSWMDRGACRESDPELFTSTAKRDQAKARKVCGMCDVRLQCLEWAIDMQITEGMFGGLGYGKRRKFANARNS